MRISKIKIISIFAFIFLASCNSFVPKEKELMPDINTPVDQMNIEFRLFSEVNLKNTFTNGDDIGLRLRNISDKTIVFTYDYNIKMFLRDNDQWKLIENQLEYPRRNPILYPEKEYKPGLFIGMIPYIQDMKENTTIRIVVVGSVKDHPDEEVAAYLDVVLKP